MAVDTICGGLLKGQANACIAPKRKYYQQIVVINKHDIDPSSIVYGNPTEEDCKYSVSFKLRSSRKGVRFAGSERGSSYFGSFSKTTSDFGFPQYVHIVNFLVMGADEETKCILDALDKGNYVVAMQFTDGTVEIYGMEQGVATGDYDYDVQTNGGGSAMTLTSNEATPENYLPRVYASVPAGQENEDFDSLFEQLPG